MCTAWINKIVYQVKYFKDTCLCGVLKIIIRWRCGGAGSIWLNIIVGTPAPILIMFRQSEKYTIKWSNFDKIAGDLEVWAVFGCGMCRHLCSKLSQCNQGLRRWVLACYAVAFTFCCATGYLFLSMQLKALTLHPRLDDVGFGLLPFTEALHVTCTVLLLSMQLKPTHTTQHY